MQQRITKYGHSQSAKVQVDCSCISVVS